MGRGSSVPCTTSPGIRFHHRLRLPVLCSSTACACAATEQSDKAQGLLLAPILHVVMGTAIVLLLGLTAFWLDVVPAFIALGLGALPVLRAAQSHGHLCGQGRWSYVNAAPQQQLHEDRFWRMHWFTGNIGLSPHPPPTHGPFYRLPEAFRGHTRAAGRRRPPR